MAHFAKRDSAFGGNKSLSGLVGHSGGPCTEFAGYGPLGPAVRAEGAKRQPATQTALMAGIAMGRYVHWVVQTHTSAGPDQGPVASPHYGNGSC